MGDPGLYGPDDRPQAVSDLQRHPQQVNRIQVAALSLSATALVGLATHEGYVEKAYQDIVGVWTIGFGTTEGVRPGQTIDPVKALQRALTDAQKFEGALKECVHVPLHQHEYDAYLSLAYNIGPRAFCTSTLVRRLNAGDYPGACKEILRWNRAGGQVVRGLVNRREQEYSLCMGGAK
jgi:lysozyme